ncbi:hypothetical protein CDAR_291631 [Caerostris darwini]|uniref:Uncharacterized protein n=1 Tax=Caerostris darwini TaxID=1538125 RepID=A0AAV4QJR8_9ARAC|nr:hypothetical protein CDAR_291631 [Caerostris darwini]
MERIVFGLTNAPNEVQGLTHRVLGPLLTTKALIEKNLEVYLKMSVDEQVLMFQRGDPELNKIICIFKKEKFVRTKDKSQFITNYVFKRERLYRSIRDNIKE